jgi:CMP-N,N'-diacetyllegionaminic acid synthase
MKNVYVVVPARGGSKGLVGKNSLEVRKRTLTVRSIVHARCITSDENIILSTDSKKIAYEVADFFKIKSYDLKLNQITNIGPFKVHFRDNSLSSDVTLISEVLYSVRELLLNVGKLVEMFCLLQPTSPFRSKVELRKIKGIISDNGDASTSLLSVSAVDAMHPSRMYFINPNGNLQELEGFSAYRSLRRQDLPPVYIRDGGFYLIGDNLVKSNVQYTEQPVSFLRKYPWSINIDGEADLIVAQNVKNAEIENDPNES